MSCDLFGPIFTPDRFRSAVSGGAWVRAMLAAEGALANAGARAGVIPYEAAEVISTRARGLSPDPRNLGERALASGNPVPPLVRALTESVCEVSEEAARHVHRGATSQDILDTAAMLVCRDALGLVIEEVEGLCSACARLAEGHRETLMAGRTLLQQALPTTFGLKAAGWMVSMLEARARLCGVRNSRLAAQLGGAVGTLASLGDSGVSVLGEFSRELGLAEPVLPWHTDRGRISEVSGALSTAAGAIGKVAADIVLMAQTEVGEVSEPAGEGRGGSSTLPHKRNPVLSVTAVASVRRVQGLAATLQASAVQEHERAAGAWHAEWEPLSQTLALTGGAAAAMREVVEGLEVHAGRMRENLDATGGTLLAESVTTRLSGSLGRLEAHDLVQGAARSAIENDRELRAELLADERLSGVIGEDELDAALDPAGYLGVADEFVGRALEFYAEETKRFGGAG